MNKTKSLPSFAMLLAGYGYDVALWGAYPEYVELLWGQTPRKHWKLALPRKDSGKTSSALRGGIPQTKRDCAKYLQIFSRCETKFWYNVGQ